ncbi:MAG: exodeoxyribonuclease III [Alphaproteobacteria bacterium]|nr:exodeoxyribonuclease III [Alphaproteobacteria bacterium]
MKIITWNINSVRLRIGSVLRLIEEQEPDILCLQETKTPDEHFPLQPLRDAGMAHIHIHGMKSYNGVAILSRHPFESSEIHHRCGKEDCRHIAARFGAFEVHNLYIPAGGDEPDAAVNEKFRHKLAFVEEMTDWFAARYTPADRLIALGDFNIAPLEHDVWSHKQLVNVVSHTQAEVERLNAMQGSLGWVDATRHFIPADEKAYTWWSYRNHDWRKSNRGRRLDHIWVTPPLGPLLKSQEILADVRDWDKPSDHVPVLAELDV